MSLLCLAPITRHNCYSHKLYVALGVKLSEEDFMTVIASAAAMDLAQEESNRVFENQTQSFHGTNAVENRVITVNGAKYHISFNNDEDTHELVV